MSTRDKVLVTFIALSLVAVSQIAMTDSALCAEESISSSEFELLRSDIRTKKMTLIAERMEFSGKEADAFWPIYRKYDVELAAINDKKIALLKEYLQSHKTLDDAKAKEIAQGVFDVDQRTLDLRKKYFEELSGAVSPKTAARFLQIERRIQQLVDVQIASQFPVIKK
jgi:phosphoglycolate phosphatase-like HAD superfamily hydrolase